MTREERHYIALAKKEIEFLSVLIEELNKEHHSFETAKRELELRGFGLSEDEYFEDIKQWQVDVTGTFVNFTLIYNNGLDINYAWVIDDYNTDLYKWGVGDFRPYYDEKSKEEWKQRRG